MISFIHAEQSTHGEVWHLSYWESFGVKGKFIFGVKGNFVIFGVKGKFIPSKFQLGVGEKSLTLFISGCSSHAKNLFLLRWFTCTPKDLGSIWGLGYRSYLGPRPGVSLVICNASVCFVMSLLKSRIHIFDGDPVIMMSASKSLWFCAWDSVISYRQRKRASHYKQNKKPKVHRYINRKTSHCAFEEANSIFLPIQ